MKRLIVRATLFLFLSLLFFSNINAQKKLVVPEQYRSFMKTIVKVEGDKIVPAKKAKFRFENGKLIISLKGVDKAEVSCICNSNSGSCFISPGSSAVVCGSDGCGDCRAFVTPKGKESLSGFYVTIL